MNSSVLSVQGEVMQRNKSYIPLKDDGSNFDEWFNQDLGELLAMLPKTSLEQILQPDARKKRTLRRKKETKAERLD